MAQGLLMEDFSKDGTERVDSVTEIRGKIKGVLPYELRTLIPEIDDEGLAGAILFVGNSSQRRIGDFDELLFSMSSKRQREIFPIQENIDEFTIFTAG